MPDRPGVVAPPPLIYAIPWFAGYFTRRLLPPITLPLWVSLSMIGFGFAFAAAAAWQLFRAKTTIDPYGSTSAIVMRGPYRITRNPLYVSLTIVYIGGALLCGATTALVLLPIALVTMHFGVIKREERYLDERFPEYAAYRSRVRRWM